MGSLHPAQSGLSNFISSQLPNNQNGENAYIQSGNIGIDANRQTGDSISFDTAAQTAHSGIQSAQTAHIGSETLTKYGNGAATVANQANGNIVSLKQGELYDTKAGQSTSTDLGSWKNSEAQLAASNALGGGVKGTQAQADLDQAGASPAGLANVQTVQSHAGEFGIQGAEGLSLLNSQLNIASQAEQKTPSTDRSNLLTTEGRSGQAASTTDPQASEGQTLNLGQQSSGNAIQQGQLTKEAAILASEGQPVNLGQSSGNAIQQAQLTKEAAILASEGQPVNLGQSSAESIGQGQGQVTQEAAVLADLAKLLGLGAGNGQGAGTGQSAVGG